MVNRGQFSKNRRVAEIIATTAAAAALTLTATSASAAGINGTVSGVNTLVSIACPTAKACVSVGIGGTDDNIGKSAIVHTATGKAKPWSGGLTDDALNAVACAAKATTCLTVADDAVATVKVATGAMNVTAVPKAPTGGIVAMGAIACASTKTCYAVGFQGTPGSSQAILVRLSGAGKLVKKTVHSGTGSGTITCPTTARCLLTDYQSPLTSIQVLTGGKIGTSNPMPTDTYVQSMSCFKASLCYALGGNTQSSPEVTDELFPVNPTTGAPGTMATISGFSGTSITCISATVCLVAGFTGLGATAKPAVVVVTSGTPGTPTNYSGQSLSGIGCATATACYAVGQTSGHAIVDKVSS
jgi:hypothetical protein